MLALSLAIGRHARDSPYFVWSIEGKWESGGEAGEGERTERKKVQEERARERPVIGHNVLETKKNHWLTNYPLQMREFDAKSIDSPASRRMAEQCHDKKCNLGGGWEWKGSRGDFAGRGPRKGGKA